MEACKGVDFEVPQVSSKEVSANKRKITRKKRENLQLNVQISGMDTISTLISNIWHTNCITRINSYVKQNEESVKKQKIKHMEQ